MTTGRRRALGQHFLRDAGIARAIVDLLAPTERDLVVEIGPGDGALTAELVRRAGRIKALEIDRGLVARYGLSAVSAPTGTGCGGAGTPVLACSIPRMGQSDVVTLIDGTPGASGFVCAGGVPAAPYVIGSGCTVEVDLATAIPIFPVTTNSSGRWITGFALPQDPGLVGIQAAMQVVLFNTAGPLGFDLSNGVIATVGY